MRHISFLVGLLLVVSCGETRERTPYSSVFVETLYEDSLSIRAIEPMGGSLAFAANNGVFGTVDLQNGKVRTNVQKYDTLLPHFRAVAHTATDFFMLSIESPALLYKTGERGKMELVYKEEGDAVFYDAMKFWNDREGLAIGDSMDGCLSMIITRDGGRTWKKMPCNELPPALESEGAFAASNSNIAVVGNNAWIGTTKGRIYHSNDKGRTWAVYNTPIKGQEPTHGIYSLDFFDEQLGIAFGGDYTKPEGNTANKAITTDGGKTWQLIANGKEPNYKSCVQFIPNTDGQQILAVGFTGISHSADKGLSWKKLSDESFFTVRFVNDSVAYAAGKDRIAKLILR